jgi:3-(3-hydroxy-phenyl)propionate hydroxylase
MQELNAGKRQAMLRELQAIAASHERAREHLLKTSMIAGLREAAQVA